MLKTRLIIVGLALAIVAGMALFIALLWVRLPGRSAPPKIQNTATILQQIQTLSELVTVKYVLEKVVILEDIKWYGENRVLLVAHGVVKAGVDLQEIKPEDVRVEDKRVIVRLPRAKITDVYLDEHKTRVVDRTTGERNESGSHPDQKCVTGEAPLPCVDLSARRKSLGEPLPSHRTAHGRHQVRSPSLP